MGQAIAFWLLAIIAVASAVTVVLFNNVFRAALSLIACFLAVAGLYITLSADFLAAVQVLIYVGAISVIIILAIMMTRDVQHGNPGNKLKLPGLLVAVVFVGIMIWTVIKTNWNIATEAAAAPTAPILAEKLLGDGGFVLPVLISATVILVAVIGAIVIAREK